MKFKISDIKIILENNPTKEDISKLLTDDRIGVKKLLESYLKNIEKKEILKKEYKSKTFYEEKWYNKGYQYICGVDEVGRGPLAGPVTACAVILKKDSYFEGLTDSKKLSEKKRDKLSKEIKDQALAYSIVSLSNQVIEEHNIYNATKIAMTKAIENLNICPDVVLIDAMPLQDLKILNESIIKGDDKSVSIAAASVLAKVHRDNIMNEYSKKYPMYDFSNNMGYGTKKHLEGISKFGICEIHRKNFEPIKTMIMKGKCD